MVANFGTTIYAAMLQKQAEDRARAERQQQFDYEKDRNSREDLFRLAQLQEQSKQSEFDRKAKLAELQGRYSGALGKSPPTGYADSAVGEYAQTGYMGGQVDRAKMDEAEALKKYVQEQLYQRTMMQQQHSDARTQLMSENRSDIAQANRDQRANLQEDKQQHDVDVLEPGKMARAHVMAESISQDKTVQHQLQALGLLGKNIPKEGPYDSVLNPQKGKEAQASRDEIANFIYKMLQGIGGQAPDTKTKVSAPQGAVPNYFDQDE